METLKVCPLCRNVIHCQLNYLATSKATDKWQLMLYRKEHPTWYEIVSRCCNAFCRCCALFPPPPPLSICQYFTRSGVAPLGHGDKLVNK